MTGPGLPGVPADRCQARIRIISGSTSGPATTVAGMRVPKYWISTLVPAVAVAAEVSKGRAQFVPGVAGKSAGEAVRWAQRAAELGADGVMCLPPTSHSPTGDEVVAHFTGVAAVGLPVIAYNNPFSTRADLTPSLLARLAEIGGVAGVKEFSQDVRRIAQIQEQAPSLEVLVGCDDLLAEGETMADKRRHLMSERDDLRRLLMTEPRGHSAMSGSIVQPTSRPDADVGVVFIEVSGCLPMCGHGTIGTATVLVETGMVEVKEPVTDIRIETPAGLVRAAVHVNDGHARAVTIQNVPSYLHLRDATAEVPGIGPVTFDLAWGGNFYTILPAASVKLRVEQVQHDALIDAGLRIMAAINEQIEFAHPAQPEINERRHVILTEPPADGVHQSVVAIHPGWADRSPCGTGTSARMAARHAPAGASCRHPDPRRLHVGRVLPDQLECFWDLVNRQDLEIVERVQQGITNPAYTGGRMCYRFEEPLHRFQNMIIDRMVGIDRVPSATTTR